MCRLRSLIEIVMKSKKIVFLSFITLLTGSILFVFPATAQIKSQDIYKENKKLKITVSSEKDSFLLGETVFLNFEVKNESSKDIRVKGLDLDSRYIGVFISADNKTFKQYKNSRVKDTMGGFLKAGDTFRSRSGILWNFDQTKISAPSTWDDLRKTYIVTDYAFPTAGEYFIKAVLTVPRIENSLKIESETIQIKIEEPTGENLEVWNKIKDNGDFAYFIQECEPRLPEYRSEERAKFLKDVEQVLIDYPNSFYAESLRESLAESNAAEFRSQEIKRKKQRRN